MDLALFWSIFKTRTFFMRCVASFPCPSSGCDIPIFLADNMLHKVLLLLSRHGMRNEQTRRLACDVF